jgi:hypothetical protein
MQYQPKVINVEAVFLTKIVDALRFLKNGELTVIQRDGVFVLTPAGTIFAPMNECYLVRWPGGLDVMDKDEFEAMYEEAE